ncbi:MULTISPECIES: pyruvate kinase [unclassified Campylobacter]|uniref:pyruvate kinase n=1 Tax=unclassified Campylobacter TaxID=2593542 RepID=UPI0022EA0485|nr:MULTISPECIES: pyruvate kinase [unclassified Campylobacter]MDA3042712.1 pyruvate kinase [Campylobacter sp. JMF_09 ED2]MDA3044474.1 pyruvate kinase [Campylobacter sp. JMF_07 ED4]MDA3063403.1 pyruvate kinase [Campylobacter sp. JMF_11 EL3]MDA3071451.1 pyruvate kinase [Campylobacter sp. VBCF_03 NA9]MDA3074485.1 pyruvate kinase [Campylobacter sp. JMF_05 ED3]
MKKAKIIATLGPASDNEEIMEAMVRAGVNVFRLNFSHNSHEYHAQNVAKIRSVEKKVGFHIGILQDICGPKIRIGELEAPFELKAGDRLDIYAKEQIGTQIAPHHYALSINQPQILPMLKAGEYVYLYDGIIRARVAHSGNDVVQTVIENDGTLSSKKGVNFPNTVLGIDVITPKDRADMEFGATLGVDFVAISFVQSANDIIKAKKILRASGSHAHVLAKIEKFDAVENIDSIIDESDGIMVARGDLGIEVPFYKVPSIQKLIIKKANEAAKPVITATQMLLSMTRNETATRAEISDVANAVLDGTDAVMLSEESAVGINPVAVVRAMSHTILEAQEIYAYNRFKHENHDSTDIMAESAVRLAGQLNADKIIALTSSGKLAVQMARYRPNIDILAVTHDINTARYLTLCWGIGQSLVIAEEAKLHTLMAKAIKSGVDCGAIKLDGTYIMTAGYPTGVSGTTNLIRMLKDEQISYYLQDA